MTLRNYLIDLLFPFGRQRVPLWWYFIILFIFINFLRSCTLAVKSEMIVVLWSGGLEARISIFVIIVAYGQLENYSWIGLCSDAQSSPIIVLSSCILGCCYSAPTDPRHHTNWICLPQSRGLVNHRLKTFRTRDIIIP